MTITLTGENSFALTQRLNELVSEFSKKNGELAVERVDAEEAEIASVEERILALPFLSVNKMVVVRNGAANKDFSERFEQIVDSIPDSTTLVLREPYLDKRTAYFKVLKRKTQFEEFAQLDKNQLAKWLVDEAKKQGATLGLADANYLVDRVGQNQQLLFNELQKLSIYNSQISKQNIDLLTDPTPQSKVFDLLDSAFGGRKSRALEIYDDQRAQKVEPQAILAMIAWQLQMLALIIFGSGKTSAEIAKQAKLNPYPLSKAAGLARKIGRSDLQSMINGAFDIDIKSKTTVLDMDEALKTYIVTL